MARGRTDQLSDWVWALHLVYSFPPALPNPRPVRQPWGQYLLWPWCFEWKLDPRHLWLLPTGSHSGPPLLQCEKPPRARGCACLPSAGAAPLHSPPSSVKNLGYPGKQWSNLGHGWPPVSGGRWQTLVPGWCLSVGGLVAMPAVPQWGWCLGQQQSALGPKGTKQGWAHSTATAALRGNRKRCAAKLSLVKCWVCLPLTTSLNFSHLWHDLPSLCFAISQRLRSKRSVGKSQRLI